MLNPRITPAQIPWMPDEDIRAEAERFLATYWGDTIPVDIELIAEFKLGLKIIPLPDLKNRGSGDGFITRDFQEIYLDMGQAAVRQRFTVAEEIGHMMLHRPFVDSLPQTHSPEEWKQLLHTLPNSQIASMEYQAKEFAGNVLVPFQHLQRAIDELLPKLNELSHIARQHGLRRHQYLDRQAGYAGSQLGSVFEVSPEVITRRLERTGLKADLP